MVDTNANIPSEILDSNLQLTPKDVGFLQETFPNAFAQAIVPVNPIHWPSFTAGSAFSSEMPDLVDKIATPINNFQVAQEYLETSQSDIQYRDRFWQLSEDTSIINSMSESGEEIGSFAAGILSNEMANRYVDEMIETAVTTTPTEELNSEIFKQCALDQNVEVSTVRGTGTFREFVPEYMKEDLCNRPPRNSRPGDDDPFSGEGILLNSHFFDWFGGYSSEETASTSSTVTYGSDPIGDRIFDFFFPEGGGYSTYSDPSMMAPPMFMDIDICVKD